MGWCVINAPYRRAIALEELTNYRFLSNIPQEIREVLREDNTSNPLAASLLAEIELGNYFGAVGQLNLISNNFPVWHDGILSDGFSYNVFPDSSPKISVSQLGSFSPDSASEIGSFQIGIMQSSLNQTCSFEVGLPEVDSSQIALLEGGTTQVSSFQIGVTHPNTSHICSPQNRSTEIGSFEVCTPQAGIGQINSTQVSLAQVNVLQLGSREISLPSSVAPEQLFTSYIHNFPSASIDIINNSAQTLWNSLLNPQTPLNINLLLTDLPAGQLAEAQITHFDPNGRPNGGTLLIDHNANGIGWYIDPTPLDSSEFTTTLTDTAFRATTNSPAAGHYDLLTTILHEMGHLAGFIDGYNGYDSHIQTLNGSQLFVGDNFTAKLTPDGSHLDPKLYPYDLMNPTLTPGVRKLPSLLDLQILNAARSVGHWDSGTILHAPFESDPLIGILNGRFDEDNTTDLDYGWSTRGATTILDEEAILNETSRFNSNFSQTFIVPEGAKYLKFTLRDTTLGNSPLDPPDAFEVALLDAHTQTSLVNTATGLTQTDAFLNIQHDGVAYYGSEVILPNTATPGSPLSLHSPMTFKVDLSGIPAGTVATLYFDLLGFGSQDGQVILDDVLLVGEPIAPTANNDTATTDQAKPVIINVLDNDRDTDGTLDPTTLAIQSNPTNGTIQINADGTMTYIPNGNFVGTDSFTYTVVDDDGLTSNEATVMVTVNNLVPTITSLESDSDIDEGATAHFTATATDAGNDILTYTWDFGDGSNTVAS